MPSKNLLYGKAVEAQLGEDGFKGFRNMPAT
jgi:hypothetical protein